jgi:hypothetical protein
MPRTKLFATWCELVRLLREINCVLVIAGKFLLRRGWQRPEHLKTAWSKPHLEWIKTKVHFAQPAQEAALTDYVHEVEHVAMRLERLDGAIQRRHGWHLPECVPSSPLSKPFVASQRSRR